MRSPVSQGRETGQTLTVMQAIQAPSTGCSWSAVQHRCAGFCQSSVRMAIALGQVSLSQARVAASSRTASSLRRTASPTVWHSTPAKQSDNCLLIHHGISGDPDLLKELPASSLLHHCLPMHPLGLSLSKVLFLPYLCVSTFDILNPNKEQGSFRLTLFLVPSCQIPSVLRVVSRSCC